MTEHAPAKVNLTLRVLGRRADGYHELESLVAFAGIGDRVTLDPGGTAGLELRGPYGPALGAPADNLVLRAARALAERVGGLKVGRFVLDKRLPVASGLGGGSADAAAALRLLARTNGLAVNDARLVAAARATGADVPVCLESRPRVMRGIGEVLGEPLDLPALPAVLVNPGVAVATKDVFARLGLAVGETRRERDTASVPTGREALLAFLAERSNDLEAAAVSLAPIIADVLTAVRAFPGCRLARMSGSGATCFALFDTAAAADAAATGLARAHPGWWAGATALGGAGPDSDRPLAAARGGQ
jgi:4-diphosphocytidyl-2-C-methyl-D-erythritol kinase